MKRYLLFFFVAFLIICNNAVAQDHNKKESPAGNKSDCVIKFQGFPCDSLYKIKGLKNVTCNNYAVFRYEDIKANADCFIAKMQAEGKLDKNVNYIVK